MIQHLAIGDRVIRVKGRQQDIGRTGVIEWMSDEMVMGSAGDVLVRVRDGGDTWTAYDRQLNKVKP